jgi:ubiquinone biosynthesis protein UbiJ
MPIAQLITSSIELAMNRLLKLDPDSQSRLKKLSDKSLEVVIKEFPWPLLFSFSEQIDVRVGTTADAVDNIDSVAADCLIELNLETLPKLKDTSQLTKLIQQKQLNLIGDIYVAQTFSSLLKDLDIDWEEQLSHYTGDVAAHQTFTSMRNIYDTAKQQLEQSSAELGARLTQPDGIAVTDVEVAKFSQDVSDLRSTTERLTARLALLENKAQPNTDK